jgi:hypothetical protein
MTTTHRSPAENTVPGASLCVLALREELAAGRMRTVGTFEIDGREITVALGADSLWAISRRDAARLAVRTAYCPSGLKARKVRPKPGELMRIALTSAIGAHVVTFAIATEGLPVLRITTRLTPAADLLVGYLPRDLYPLGPDDDPLTARGNVEAAQRGLNAGLLYWRIDGDTPGSLLYIQNLTAMNAYYNATHTKPDAAVGGEWPELGYLLPTPEQSGTPPVRPAAQGGDRGHLSDALLVFHRDAPPHERRVGAAIPADAGQRL